MQGQQHLLLFCAACSGCSLAAVLLAVVVVGGSDKEEASSARGGQTSKIAQRTVAVKGHRWRTCSNTAAQHLKLHVIAYKIDTMSFTCCAALMHTSVNCCSNYTPAYTHQTAACCCQLPQSTAAATAASTVFSIPT
eukprot:8067-Heterococcus_DN1.PRE.2